MDDFGFPKQNKSQESGRKGEVYFENFVTNRLGWIYRPVPQESDFGIDGYIDIVEEGKVTGKSIAIQIKCGDSYTSKITPTGIKYIGKNKHLNYYINLTTPIILVVLSSDFSSSCWIEFEIELTSPTKSGWWIEIPKRNLMGDTVLSKWSKIAGPSSDFSEAIKNEWLLDSTIKESDYTCFWIPRIEVELGKYDHIKSVIRKLSKNHELLLSRKGTLDIFFPEYDNDSRELYEIPEVRKWFKGSIEEGIPWFYFLTTKWPAAGLKLLLFCSCKVKFLGVEGSRHKLEVDVKERSEWLMYNFYNLNLFADQNEISEEINKECCDAITWLLFNLFE